MAKSTCKCKKVECEECPEWIFTFADLVMLMMGFFVILWVLKPTPGKNNPPSESSEDDWNKTVAAIRQSFGYVPDAQSKDPIDMILLHQKLAGLKLTGPHNGGETDQEKGTKGTDDTVTNIRPSKHATQGGKMLFERGSTAMSASTKAALDQLAEEVRGHRNIVMIKGHTALDDLPENATAQQKMDLSLRRAEAAADYLTQHGVDPRILRVQGCSIFEPLTEREYNADSQSENRRIEVEVTNTLSDELQGKQTTQPTEDRP